MHASNRPRPFHSLLAVLSTFPTPDHPLRTLPPPVLDANDLGRRNLQLAVHFRGKVLVQQRLQICVVLLELVHLIDERGAVLEHTIVLLKPLFESAPDTRGAVWHRVRELLQI